MKNKILYIFLFSILNLFSACVYTEKIRDGKTSFERKQYNVAIPMLEKEFKKAKIKKEKGVLAFKLGESLSKTGKNEAAIAWYKAAMENSYGTEAGRAYAFSLKKDEQYGESLKAFKALGVEIESPFEFKKDIEACQVAAKWKVAQSPYFIEKQTFNSPNDDYSPTQYAADQLVITSDRSNNEKDEKSEKYKWTGRSFSDLYLVNVVTDNIATVKSFSAQINTNSNEGTPTFNSDFNEMIFVKNDENGDEKNVFTKLYFSKRDGALWSEPEVLPFCEEKANYWHPTLSADAKTLIFSCNSENGFGGYDLYFTQKNNNKWSNPRLLPRNINTNGNEVFPTFDADTLYFSSDTHLGMGGYDIFKTFKIGENNWAQPVNLKAPINSGADDFSLIIDKNVKLEKNTIQRGFFTSNRKGGQGGDDIYGFKKINLPPPPVDTTVKTAPKEVVYKLLLDAYVLEKIYASPDNPNSKVVGRKGVPNAVVTINVGGQNKKVVTNNDGFFTEIISENADYQFVARKENYLNNTATFSSKGIGKDPNNPIQKFEIEIVLDKIYKNKEVVLENIYYDYDKWDIRSDAQPTLNTLAQTLIENPTIKIQLNSHTDCRGNDSYNQELSQRRAQSAVDYLISKGIDSNRLIAKGFGESSPATPCVCNKCLEEEHQANRRTSFTILE